MVNINNAAVDPMADVWGKLQGGPGIPTFKFSVEQPEGSGIWVPKGTNTSYIGRISELPFFQQARDFTTKEAKTFSDGNPIEDLVLTFDTDLRDAGEEDDGKRRLYANNQQRKALLEELRRLGQSTFGIGTVMRWTHTGFGTNTKGGRAPYVYSCEILEWQPYVPEAQAALQQGLQQGAQPQQQWAQPAAPQQPVQPQQQYVNPGHPAFAGQVVPAPQPVQHPVQPQPQAPAPLSSADLLAQVQASQAAQAPAPAAPAIAVTQDHIGMFNMLNANGITPDAAIAAVVENVGGDDDFRSRLAQAVFS